jgi:hypothetical protein
MLVPASRSPVVSSGAEDEAYSLSGQDTPKRRRSPISASGDSEHPTVVQKDRARQGVTGRHVRYALGFGLAAIVVAFAVIHFPYFG